MPVAAMKASISALLPMEMRPEYFDRVVRSYFTVLATANSPIRG